jgi:GcrA cell cycle regulator
MTSPAYSLPNLARFTELWNDGVFHEAIKGELHICSETIHKWRVELNLPIRGEEWWRDFRCRQEITAPNQTLAELWAAGITAVQIGFCLGLTKNQVIGRVHRMKLPPRPSPIKRDGYFPPRIKRAPMVTLPSPETKPPPCPSQASAAAVVQELATPPVPQRVAPSLPRVETCIWTTGSRGAWVCCDAQRLRGSLFCPEHQKRGTVGDVAAAHRHRAAA